MKSGILSSTQKVERLLPFLREHKEFSFDTETDGLSHDRKCIGFSLSVLDWDEYVGWYIPLRHERGEDLFSVEPSNVPLKVAYKIIEEIFKEGNRVWIHNAKFDLKVLRNEGFDVGSFGAEVLDTIAVSWLLAPERKGGHGLKSLVPSILNKEMGGFNQFKIYGKNEYVPVGEMGRYAIDDAVYLLELAHRLYQRLSEQQLKVFHELEMPMMRIVEEMEHYGFRVDVDKLKEAGDALELEAQKIEREFREQFGPTAQISSPQWLATNFCGKIWGEDGNKGKDGRPSTSSEYLNKWAEGCIQGTTEVGKDIASKVLRYRKVSKLVSTYCKALVEAADHSNRVHGSFNQWGTGTGRMSSSNPNMQNIPSSRSKEGDLIRRSFIAADGYKLIVADYSQIELRVTAHLSEDPIMMGIYRDNGDIHQMTADACNCARFDAKAINFGLIYKMGAKTLAKAIKKTEEEAQDYIDRYFENYSGVAKFQDDLVARCRRKGYTWTITGRHRPLENIASERFGLRNGDERKAINTQVQGSAADIIKIGMRNFHRRLREEGLTSEDFRIIGQVHDEVVVEVKEGLAERVSEALQYEMENCVKLRVPLIAEPCIGDSWGEAK